MSMVKAIDKCSQPLEISNGSNTSILDKIKAKWKGKAVFIHVSKLRENKWNINEMDLEVYESLKEQMKQGEILRPLIVCPDPLFDGYYEVLDGNHKLKIARELGIAELPCIIENIEPKDRLSYMLKLNTKGRVSIEKLCELMSYFHEKKGKSLSEIADIFKPLLGGYGNKYDVSKILKGHDKIKQALRRVIEVEKRAKAKEVFYRNLNSVIELSTSSVDDIVYRIEKKEWDRAVKKSKSKPKPLIWRHFTCPVCKTKWNISYDKFQREYVAWNSKKGKKQKLERPE